MAGGGGKGYGAAVEDRTEECDVVHGIFFLFVGLFTPVLEWPVIVQEAWLEKWFYFQMTIYVATGRSRAVWSHAFTSFIMVTVEWCSCFVTSPVGA